MCDCLTNHRLQPINRFQIAAVTFTVTLCDEVDIIITFYRKGDIDST